MNLRMRVRQWLGITEIQEDQSMLNKRLQDIQSVLVATQGQSIAANSSRKLINEHLASRIPGDS